MTVPELSSLRAAAQFRRNRLPLWWRLRTRRVAPGESRIEAVRADDRFWWTTQIRKHIAYEATMRVAAKRSLHVRQVNSLYEAFVRRYGGWDTRPAVLGLGMVLASVQHGNVLMRATVTTDPWFEADDAKIARAREASRRAWDRITRLLEYTNRRRVSISDPLGLAQVLAIELEEVLRVFKRPPQRKQRT